MEFCAELTNATPVDSIPGFASPSEFGMYTIASVEESYNNMMEEIGISELATVLEAKDGGEKKEFSIKALVDKFVGWVKDIWQKFMGLVKKCRDYIIVFVTDKIVKIQKRLKEKDPNDIIDAVEESEASSWENFRRPVKFDPEKLTAIISATNKAVDECIKYVDKAEALDEGGMKDFEKKVYGPLKTALAPISDDDIKDASKIKAAVKLKVSGGNLLWRSGEQAKDEISKDLHNILVYYKSKNNVIKSYDDAIKKPYNEHKKNLDKAIREAKKAKNSKELKPLFSAVKVASKVSNTVVNACMDVIISKAAFDMRVLVKALAMTKIQESATVESAKYESSSFQTELGSLFNF